MTAELWLCAFWVRFATARHKDQNKHVRESIRALPAAGMAVRGAAPGAGPEDRGEKTDMKNTQIAENERVTNGTKKWKKKGQMTSFLDSMEARVRYEKEGEKKQKTGRAPYLGSLTSGAPDLEGKKQEKRKKK